MDDLKFHFEGIRKVLADEQVGGLFAEELKKLFASYGAKLAFISSDIPTLKGKSDAEVCEWAAKNSYDAIITEDIGMITEAVNHGLAVFQIRHSDNHKRLTLFRVYKLKSWSIKISED
ncbi:MAG: hypothetical protein ACP6IS_08570 [Candidatus Asgardarchaeia archaeon]